MTELHASPAVLPAPTRPWPVPPILQASAGVHLAAAAAAALLPGAWPWALGAVALNHGVLTGLGLWPRSRALGPNITRLPPVAASVGASGGASGSASGSASGGAVALTLDDGPNPELTPRVLDVLDAAGMRATFFCIARKAQAAPALVREIQRRGHSVQNHSQHHAHTFSLFGPQRLAQEINQAQHTLADITGEWPHCFRAPAGLRSPLLDPVLHRLGLHLVSWTRRGFDTRPGPAAAVLARLQRGLAAGDILLLHDGNPGCDAATGQPLVLSVLPPLLAQLREAGLHGVTLRDALPRRNAEVA